MTIITEKHKAWKFYKSLLICGEISVSSDFCSFGINCKLCATIFLMHNDFVEHVLEKHIQDVLKMYEKAGIQCPSTDEYAEELDTLRSMAEEENPKDPDVEEYLLSNDALDRFGEDFSENFEEAYVLKEFTQKYLDEESEDESPFLKFSDSTNEDESSSFFKFEDSNNEEEAKNIVVSYELQMKLAVIYKEYPALWDTTYPEEQGRTKHLEKMLKQVNQELNLHLTAIQLKRRLVRLRKQYIKEKQKSILSFEHKHPFKPSHPELYNLLDFLHEHIGPFRCKLCSEIFASPRQYRHHLNEHEGKTRFICKICKEDLFTVYRYRRHMSKHVEKTNYCRYCRKSFSKKYDMAQHELTHGVERNYKCQYCDKSFVNGVNLRAHRHRQHRHNINKQNKFHCPKCIKTFPSLPALGRHIQQDHTLRSNPEKPKDNRDPNAKHKCSICGLGFKEKLLLKQHEEIHLDVRFFKCQNCDKLFSNEKSLVEHENKEHSILNNKVMEALDLDLDIILK